MMAAEPSSTAPAISFLLGAALIQTHDAEQLGALVKSVLGVDVAPAGDVVVLGGVRFGVGYEAGTQERTLRAEEFCTFCGDPIRSEPITTQHDLADFLMGRHREKHVHGWLSGE